MGWILTRRFETVSWRCVHSTYGKVPVEQVLPSGLPDGFAPRSLQRGRAFPTQLSFLERDQVQDARREGGGGRERESDIRNTLWRSLHAHEMKNGSIILH